MDVQTARRQSDALRMLHEISRAINTGVAIGPVLDLIMDGALRLTRAERGFLVMAEADGGVRVLSGRQLDRKAIDQPGFRVSRGVIEESLRTAQPVLLGDAGADPEFASHESVRLNKPKSIACVPMKLRGVVIGAVYLDSRLREGLFEAEEVILLELFADHVATAVDRARLEAKIARLGLEVTPPRGTTLPPG